MMGLCVAFVLLTRRYVKMGLTFSFAEHRTGLHGVPDSCVRESARGTPPASHSFRQAGCLGDVHKQPARLWKGKGEREREAFGGLSRAFGAGTHRKMWDGDVVGMGPLSTLIVNVEKYKAFLLAYPF